MATKSTTAKKSAAKSAAKKAPAKKAAAKKAPAKKSAVVKALEKKQAAEAPAVLAPTGEAPKPTRRAKAEGTYADLAANRFTSSKVENPVRAMWDLCDAMVENRRKDVIAAAVAKGISYYTARTQYQLWLTAYRNSK